MEKNIRKEDEQWNKNDLGSEQKFDDIHLKKIKEGDWTRYLNYIRRKTNC